MRGRFRVKVELELHSISCPGVWLCPSGYVEVTLKSLGYFFKTGPKEPKFPLLAHELFTMEGYFKSVQTMEDLERSLSLECIEIAIWQTGQRLAHYKGSLGRILQSVASPSECVHLLKCGRYIQKHIVSQLFMTPSRNFPGVLSPKIEISGRATFRSPSRMRCSCQCRNYSDIQLSCQPLERNATSHDENHNKLSRPIRRQRPVCHANRLANNGPPQDTRECIHKDVNRMQNDNNTPVFVLTDNVRHQDRSQSTTTSSSRYSCHSNMDLSHLGRSHQWCASNIHFSDSEDDHSKSCDICQSYKDIFRSPHSIG